MSSYKRWQVACPCCSGCDVTFQATTCLDAYTYWGNLVPAGLVSPSSVAVYMAVCTGLLYPGGGLCDTCYGVSQPVSEIFYPLEDPSTTGIHVFHLNKNQADTLVVQYDNEFWPTQINPYRYFYLIDSNCDVLCNASVRHKLIAIDGISIQDPPCYWTAIEGGATWHVDYSLPISAAALAYLENALPYQIAYFSLGGSTQCGITYCTPDCIGAFCTCGNTSCNISGPYNTAYYKIFTNNSKVTFTIPPANAIINQQQYCSDYQLLYAYVTYYPSGSYVLCSSVLGELGTTYYDKDYAVVSYTYGIISVNGGPNFNCFLPDLLVAYTNIPGLDQSNNCNFDQVYNVFCGSGAFDKANNFASNLPQTVQIGEYGTTPVIATGPGESFLAVTASGDCNAPTYYNQHSWTDCNNNVTSGYHTLTIRPN